MVNPHAERPTMASSSMRATHLLSLALLAHSPTAAFASWYNNNGGGDGNDALEYSSSTQSDWLYSSSAISIVVNGCVWSAVDDNEDVGCMEDESEEGTTYWYQMANCRRANVAYSVYATDSGSSVSCNDASFKESFVTKDGLAEFAYLVSTYDQNSPFANVDTSSLPMCEEDGNGYYQSVGCASDGTFTIDTFYDAYCIERVGTYDTLSSLNSAMKNMKNCYNCFSSSSNEDASYSLCGNLIPYSESCTSMDSQLCTTSKRMQDVISSERKKSGGSKSKLKTWATKAKYVLGTMLFVSSFVMFMGILFTNRRRRRAAMHRKMRRSKAAKSSSFSHRSRRSKSRSRSAAAGGGGGSSGAARGRASGSGSVRRSRSKSRDAAGGGGGAGAGGGVVRSRSRSKSRDRTTSARTAERTLTSVGSMKSTRSTSSRKSLSSRMKRSRSSRSKHGGGGEEGLLDGDGNAGVFT